MLHKHKIACGKIYGVYIYLLQKDNRKVAISFECLIFCEKTGRHKMILQLSECLSATNICEENMFPMCEILDLLKSEEHIYKSKTCQKKHQ